MLAPLKISAPTSRLSAAGVSLWLNDLSRRRLQSGSLKNLITTKRIVGVTTDPVTFHNAFQDHAAYDQRIRELASRGATIDSIVRVLITDDVRDATDLFSEVYCQSRGLDGRVSIAVDPRLAHDTEATIEQAEQLFEIIDRNNILIEIPATQPGLAAITAVTARGISVNATLIFAPEQYTAVMDAYVTGLELARLNGHNLSQIRSVASFAIALVDAEIDRRLLLIDTPAANACLGQAGLATATLAYQAYEQTFAGERWLPLTTANAHKQRPLWATNVEPSSNDTRYFTSLVAPGTVLTASEDTIAAFTNDGSIRSNANLGNYPYAAEILGDLDGLGIDLGEVSAVLQDRGITRFTQAWNELLDSVGQEVHLDLR